MVKQKKTFSFLSYKFKLFCFSGKQCVWDLKQSSIVWQYDNNVEGSDSAMNNNKCISMCLNDEQTLIACGSADGYCRVLNINNGKLLSSFACFQPSSSTTTTTTKSSMNEDEDENDDDDDDDEGESTATTIESVAFGIGHLLICGTLSGYIYIWDINTKQLRGTLNLQSGIVKCILNEGYLLYTACLDGHIRLLDIRNGEPLKEWKSGGGQGCEIMDMIITKDKRYLLCAYMQGLCRVFQLKE
jgi:WD40 repeat protein